jgi:hypothetical protein
MTTVHLTRRIALVAGGAAIIGMGALTAGCSTPTKDAPAPSSTSTATSSAPAPSSAPATSTAPSLSPTEKDAIKPIPSLEDRGAMDSHGCAPGQSKYNGVCQ